jgi:hypothetical protein
MRSAASRVGGLSRPRRSPGGVSSGLPGGRTNGFLRARSLGSSWIIPCKTRKLLRPRGAWEARHFGATGCPL